MVKLTTERLLYEAIDYGLITDNNAAFYMSYKSCYPENWYDYNPNHYVRREQRLDFRDKLLFFLALMDYHITEDEDEIQKRQMYYVPNKGLQYKHMLHAAVNKNI